MVTGIPQHGASPLRPEAGRPPQATPARRLPPVTSCLVAALILVIAGGIDMAAHLPGPAPLAPAIGALAAAAALALLAAAAWLTRLRGFAWHTFRVVAGWTLAAYAVIAGMLEYVFVLDHTPAGLLTLLSLMLAVFAVDVPLLLAFSVARYQSVPDAP